MNNILKTVTTSRNWWAWWKGPYLVGSMRRNAILIPLTEPVIFPFYQLPAVEDGQEWEQQTSVLVISHSASIVTFTWNKYTNNCHNQSRMFRYNAYSFIKVLKVSVFELTLLTLLGFLKKNPCFIKWYLCLSVTVVNIIYYLSGMLVQLKEPPHTPPRTCGFAWG